MNLTTLIADVRSRLDEDTAGFWTDTAITRWLNEANTNLSMRLENLEDTDTQNGVDGQANYTLPSDYLKAKRVTYNSLPLGWIDFPRLNQFEAQGSPTTSSEGTPEYFYIYGGVLYIYPVPTANLTNGLKLYYVKRPAALSAGADTPEHDEQWHYLLSLYACHLGYVRDVMMPEADRMLNQYLDGVAQARAFLAVPQRAELSMIRYVDE